MQCMSCSLAQGLCVNVPGINPTQREITPGRDLTCPRAAPCCPTLGKVLCARVKHTTAALRARQGHEAGSLITFTVQTVAAGSDAQDIKSSLCSLHAINQTNVNKARLSHSRQSRIPRWQFQCGARSTRLGK